MDINTDPRHSKITDLYTALSCSMGQTSPWPQVAVKVIHINVAPGSSIA